MFYYNAQRPLAVCDLFIALKDYKYGNGFRIFFWGGGVNKQQTSHNPLKGMFDTSIKDNTSSISFLKSWT